MPPASVRMHPPKQPGRFINISPNLFFQNCSCFVLGSWRTPDKTGGSPAREQWLVRPEPVSLDKASLGLQDFTVEVVACCKGV